MYVRTRVMYVRILTHIYHICITGFLSRMLATLYDLEVVEEKGVRDWLSPPDNRHSFLKQAKDEFNVKDNVEAKKQVLLPRPPHSTHSSHPPAPHLPALPCPAVSNTGVRMSPLPPAWFLNTSPPPSTNPSTPIPRLFLCHEQAQLFINWLDQEDDS